MNECEIHREEHQEGEIRQHQEMCLARWMFRCALCDGDFVSKEGLWNHLDVHEIADESKELHYHEIKTKLKYHQCVLCNDQRAYSESLYWSHVHDVHDGFILRDCGEKFRSEFKNDHSLSNCKDRDQAITFNFSNLEVDHVPIEGVDLPGASMDDRLSEYSRDNLNTTSDADNNNMNDEETLLHPIDSAEGKNQLNFACNICGLKFTSNVKVRYHKTMKHTEPRYECAKCSKKFRNRKSYRRHLKACGLGCGAVQKVLTSQTCSHCKKKLPSAFTLASHILINHDPVACDMCGITLSSFSQAQEHQKKAHKETKYKCPHCSLQFAGRQRFQKHVSKCEIKTFPCEFCGAMFNHLRGLSVHKQKVCPAKKAAMKVRNDCTNSSDMQGQKNADRSLLTQKEKILELHDESDSSAVTGKISSPFLEGDLISKSKCHYCYEEFFGPEHLNLHLKRHHELTKCDICGITVLGISRNKNHKKMYHTTPELQCPTCGMKYHKGYYHVHQSICERKKYSCESCDRTFSHQAYLKQHKLRCRSGESSRTIAPIGQHQKQAQKNYPNMETAVEETTISARDDQGQSTVRVRHDETIELKMEIQVEDTMLQEQEYQVPNGDSKRSFATPSHSDGNKSKDVEAEDAVLVYGIKIKEEPLEDEEKNFIAAHSTTEATEYHGTGSQFGSCSICGHIFLSIDKMKYHMRTFHTEPKLKCLHCPKMFHLISKLHRHEKSCSELTCHKCDLKFTTRHRLQNHKKNIHNELLFKCPECGKSFKHSGTLQNHIDKHSNIVEKKP